MYSSHEGRATQVLLVIILSSVLCPTFLLLPMTIQAFVPSTQLMHSSKNIPNFRPLFQIKKDTNTPLTTAKRERRDEEVRRKDRQQEVVPGKTSAIPGAKDYQLNPSATTEEWMKHASKVEQEVFRWTETGMAALKMFQLHDASCSFDKVFELRPTAYLWQAVIPKYYLGEYIQGATIMCQCASLAEAKFGLPASEERIWRDACQIKYNTQQQNKNDTLFPQVMNDLDAPETRKVIRIAKELFSSTLNDNTVGVVLARAKLRAICGTGGMGLDRKLWKLTSWFYLGLHYDAIGDVDESKECMKKALELCPNANGDDIIHALPMLHMSIRDWYDDDAFEADNEDNNLYSNSRSGIKEDPPSTTDQVVLASIQQSVGEMKLSQLQDALKVRGLKIHGIKDELQRKLIVSLCEDLGLNPGV